MIKNDDHYLVLDAARGIAAMAVLLYHLHKFIFPEIQISFMPHLFSRSFLAVDLFFLMSGLVIAKAYEEKLQQRRMTFLSFCSVRFIRLFPLYFAGTFLGLTYVIMKFYLAPEAPLYIWQEASIFLMNIVFIPYMFDPEVRIFPYDAAAWSLALEWYINLAYAFWAVHRSTRTLIIATIVSGICLAVAALSYGYLDMGWGASTMIGGIFRICFSFTLGVVMHRLMKAGKLNLPKVNVLVLLGGLTILLLTPFGKPNVYYDLFCAYAVFPVFVALACAVRAPDPLRPSFDILGRTSYALYILHTPLILWLAGIWKQIAKTEPASMPMITAPFFLLGTCAISYLATVYFDETLRGWLRKKQRAKQDQRLKEIS